MNYLVLILFSQLIHREYGRLSIKSKLNHKKIKINRFYLIKRNIVTDLVKISVSKKIK